MASNKSKFVQVCNPKTEKFVKINTTVGSIVAHKSTKGPYKGITIKGKRYDLKED
jgi:hypothetical protein